MYSLFFLPDVITKSYLEIRLVKVDIIFSSFKIYEN